MSKLRWQRKFSALLDWFLLSGIVLVASVHCSNHDSSLFSVAVADLYSSQSQYASLSPTRRYAFRHFRTWMKYAFHHTIDWPWPPAWTLLGQWSFSRSNWLRPRSYLPMFLVLVTRIIVVDSGGDEGTNECRCWFGVQRPLHPPMESVKTVPSWILLGTCKMVSTKIRQYDRI